MHDSSDDLNRLILVNTRPWNKFWSWHDRPVGEHGAAQEVIKAAGFKVQRLVSRERGQDPPDCEAMLDDKWSGIEVTELVHELTLRRSIKAITQRAAGMLPEHQEAHFVWERDDLLDAIDLRLNNKDRAKPKDSSYEQYVLIIYTDEMYLDRERVGRFLKDAAFRTKLITHAFLGLSYDPTCKGYPVFGLNLSG
jgi:hypothetical protein